MNKIRSLVDIHVLPGGIMPKRQTEGSVGYDVHIRAVVSPFEMDSRLPSLRKTLFDFDTVVDASIRGNVEIHQRDNQSSKEQAYRLDPGKKALAGVGFATAMPFPMCFLVLCRSGMATKHDIMVANGPGTVDADYRGEAGVSLFNTGTEPFYIFKGMRIAQIVFIYAIIPELIKVSFYGELTKTKRGSGGFGSTGLH